ncbi:MAG: M48 family metallopeptidase [Bdellovibrionales bacterium]
MLGKATIHRITGLKTNRPRIIVDEDSGIISWKTWHFKWKRKAFYRNINIQIQKDGMAQITTGKNPPRAWIESFLFEKETWIEQQFEKINLKLSESKEIHPLGDKEWIPYLGEFIQIQLKPKKSRNREKLLGNQLLLFIGSSPSKSELQESVIRFYKKQALEVFEKLQAEISLEMGLKPKKISIRAQKSRWGSCSSLGNINYNFKLLAGEPDEIRYVVIHETAHLKHMNHSKKFWNLVATLCPNFKEVELGLAEDQLRFEFLTADSNIYNKRYNLG